MTGVGRHRFARLALGAAIAAAMTQPEVGSVAASPLRLSGEVGHLFPGKAQQMRVEVGNRDGRPVRLRWVQVRPVGGSAACPVANLDGGERRPNRTIGPRGAVTVKLPLRLRAGAPDACQGTRFRLRLRAHASGVTAGGSDGDGRGAGSGGSGGDPTPRENPGPVAAAEEGESSPSGAATARPAKGGPRGFGRKGGSVAAAPGPDRRAALSARATEASAREDSVLWLGVLSGAVLLLIAWLRRHGVARGA